MVETRKKLKPSVVVSAAELQAQLDAVARALRNPKAPQLVPGESGWSDLYEEALTLRRRHDAMQEALIALARAGYSAASSFFRSLGLLR